jgi:SAM-dependent methyltransferase
MRQSPLMSSLPHYTLGATDAELHRLISLASHEEDRVLDACRRAGIAEGAVVADLGCGPLGALSALARVVGTTGTVIGVDASAEALAKARLLLPDTPQVRLIHTDVHDLSPKTLGVPTLDAVYCRLFLLHQPDPARVLTRIATLLRPGGVLITHEPSDHPTHAPASEPHSPAMTRVWELVIAAARTRGAPTDFARRGRAYLEAAGFSVQHHHAYTVHYPPHIGYEIPRVALASVRPVLEQHHLATPAELAQLDAELRQMQERDDVQWVSSPLMFEWIGRKGGELIDAKRERATGCHTERRARDLGGRGGRHMLRAPPAQVPHSTLGMTEESTAPRRSRCLLSSTLSDSNRRRGSKIGSEE